MYYEIEGEGPPVVMVHGFALSLESNWKAPKWVESLKNDYKLILLDCRGHGKSDKPHDEESYRMEKLVGDVTTVLDALELEKTHFFGYSLGGGIAYELVRHVPERLISVITGGAGAEVPSIGIYEEVIRYLEVVFQQTGFRGK